MREINISLRASKRLDNLLKYLELEWSVKVKREFIEKIDKALNQIQELPDSFPKSDEVKNLHKCVVTKQTSMYYRYTSKTITIVAIIDNRYSDNRKKKEVK
ncbi:MAG: type II toxin-antitoxin system RelE/ParE family toxin [Cyclobacteriaceae bacterium]|nr:type II toxin-antitoxin system RelE/ParE family toxin [Cyclobacteriaceae bacterium]